MSHQPSPVRTFGALNKSDCKLFPYCNRWFGGALPTSRSLAAVTTGEPVYREESLPGAVLVRVASSHIRIGTVQFFSAQNDIEGLRLLIDHVITRHYPEVQGSDNPTLALLDKVMQRQAELIASWQMVGFIHGVMNTDNMLLSGETIDYGPCAFMDTYNPETVFSSIDHGGRYAYQNQPGIAQVPDSSISLKKLTLFCYKLHFPEGINLFHHLPKIYSHFFIMFERLFVSLWNPFKFLPWSVS